MYMQFNCIFNCINLPLNLSLTYNIFIALTVVKYLHKMISVFNIMLYLFTVTYLKTLEKKIDRLNEEVCGQKKAAASNFNIDTCTFKVRNNYLMSFQVVAYTKI